MVKISRSAIIGQWDWCYEVGCILFSFQVGLFSRGRISSGKNWDPLQSANLHCTVIVSIHQLHLQDHQLKSRGRIFKSESLWTRISMLALVGQAWATSQNLWIRDEAKTWCKFRRAPCEPLCWEEKVHELTNGRVWKTQNGMHIENEVIGLMKKGLAKKVSRAARSRCRQYFTASHGQGGRWASHRSGAAGGKWRNDRRFRDASTVAGPCVSLDSFSLVEVVALGRSSGWLAGAGCF